MSLETTLSIIKPDAYKKGHVEEICQRLENAGLSIKEKKTRRRIKKRKDESSPTAGEE